MWHGALRFRWEREIFWSYVGGFNDLFRRIIFRIHRHGKWFLKNCISYFWSEEIIVVGYNLVSFLHNCMENISVFKNVFFLSNNEHLFWYDFSYWLTMNLISKILLGYSIQKIINNINENPQNVLIIKIVFSIRIVFSINRKASVLSK